MAALFRKERYLIALGFRDVEHEWQYLLPNGKRAVITLAAFDFMTKDQIRAWLMRRIEANQKIK